MDSREIIDSLIDIEQAKSIDKQAVIDVIVEGFEKACIKQFGKDGKYIINVNESTGEISIKRIIMVVKNVSDEKYEIDIEEAKELDETITVGDELEEELRINDFGRLAINAMKQHITSELLKQERVSLFNDFSDKIDSLVNGSVKKINRRMVFINLNRLEAIMPIEETIPGERYRLGQLIKAVVVEVRQDKGDPRVILSRKSDKFLTCLLEFEVPEIEEGSVVIKGIARVPGLKSKIAVMSTDDKIDPVGACVGVKGSRIRTIIKELNNEHIDIIQWSYDPIIFTQRVISPGVVIRAFKNDEEKSMKLVVKDESYDRAIGRENINVKLASELTGWQIEVINDSSFKESERSDEMNPIFKISGITENIKEKLIENGFETPEDVIEGGEEALSKISGIGSKKIKKILESISDYLKSQEGE